MAGILKGGVKGMTKEKKKAIVTVLKKIIRLYKETTFIPQPVSFSNEKLRIQSSDLTGELLDYYQHIVFNEDLFFANQNFNIILLALDSPTRTVECWALQDILQFSKGQYQIFATTDTDDILFCDMTLPLKSPVQTESCEFEKPVRRKLLAEAAMLQKAVQKRFDRLPIQAMPSVKSSVSIKVRLWTICPHLPAVW